MFGYKRPKVEVLRQLVGNSGSGCRTL
jgi:hypothetical protein